jgi:hypothetical protein
MKRQILISVILLSSIVSMNAQWSGTAPGNIYYNQGNVGIGTATPSYPLEINGINSYVFSAKVKASTGKYIANFVNSNNEGLFICHTGSDNAFYRAGANAIVLAADQYNGGTYRNLAFSTNSSIVMTLTTGGNIGIGTTTPQNKLDVNGTIHAREVKVDLTGWSDFVFAPTYKLKPLKEVEHYINTNRHLPEIPSAKDV